MMNDSTMGEARERKSPAEPEDLYKVPAVPPVSMYKTPKNVLLVMVKAGVAKGENLLLYLSFRYILKVKNFKSAAPLVADAAPGLECRGICGAGRWADPRDQQQHGVRHDFRGCGGHHSDSSRNSQNNRRCSIPYRHRTRDPQRERAVHRQHHVLDVGENSQENNLV